MTLISRYVKRVAAIALLICLFLPLSQCTTQTAYGNDYVHLKYVYNVYAWPSVDAALALAIFLWPVILMVIVVFRPRLEKNFYYCFIELILSAGSGYVLASMLIYSTKILLGGYLALTSFTAYFLCTAGIMLSVMWAKWVSKYA